MIKENNRLASLQAKHASLDAELKAETARPSCDDAKVKELKLQKLKLKEEIEALNEAK